ncbi:MAG: hypothetical protein QNJ46_35165 [Leptolyngbyaceae cyanobacterium MO_188.B28]|nr:hypothetical protein [Leptolyngbyaceae cyanobacterium MO_188.B28]
MNPLTGLSGGGAIAYGFYTLLLRSQNPTKFGKLTAMKEQWGEQMGSLIHLVAYSIISIAFGVIMLIRS